MAPQAPITVSGQVYEVVPGGKVPAAGFPVLLTVVTTSSCSPPCSFTRTWNRSSTTTGADGRYRFTDLPEGPVSVYAGNPSTHRQLCGAAANLRPGSAVELDVELTSNTNPQPPTSLPPLRVTGQVYEITPAGRVGIDNAWIGLDWLAADSVFLTIYTGKDGRYTICGVPAAAQMGFDVGQIGYEGFYAWRVFNTDTTFDIELKRE